MLFGKLELPVIRRTKTGPSTDADVLEELASLHPVPAQHRRVPRPDQAEGHVHRRAAGAGQPGTGRLHTTFNQAVAATGRLSSSDPNLQNIPIRTEVGRRIRQAFVAEPGYLLVSADYSQIELRILAHFSQDPAFLDAFRSGADIHQRTAAEVFAVSPDSVSRRAAPHRQGDQLRPGVRAVATSGWRRCCASRAPPPRRYITSYFERYAGVRALHGAVHRRGARHRVRQHAARAAPPDPRDPARRPQDRAYAERIARNTPIQGSAADLLKLAMIRVDAGPARRSGRAPACC